MKTRRCDSLRGGWFHGFPSQETYRTKFRYVLRGIGENDGIKPSGLFPSPLNFALNPLLLKIILVFFAAKNIENAILGLSLLWNPRETLNSSSGPHFCFGCLRSIVLWVHHCWQSLQVLAEFLLAQVLDGALQYAITKLVLPGWRDLSLCDKWFSEGQQGGKCLQQS